MLKVLYLVGCSIVIISALTDEDDGKHIQLLYSPSTGKVAYALNETNSNGLSPKNKMVFLVHGWTEDETSNYYPVMFEEYMKKGGYNVIRVNWKNYSNTGYFTAKMLVERVGAFIAKFIIYIHINKGIPLEQVHIVGHSLGAHVAGIAGYTIQKVNSAQNEMKIGRITGLDPAGPFFNYMTPDVRRLDSNDAKMVDCLYTNRGLFGTLSTIGSVNFYANNAAIQPGCPLDNDNKTSIFVCSHQRSTVLFTESINSKRFIAKKIESFLFEPQRVNENIKVIFGEDTNAEPGMYQFDTNSNKPYAMG